MFQSSGYFRGIYCPFYVSGLCERPYCHFRHSRVEEKPSSSSKQDNSPCYSTSTRPYNSTNVQPISSSSLQASTYGQKDVASYSTLAPNEPAGLVEAYQTSSTRESQATKTSTCSIPSFSEIPQSLPEPDEVPVQLGSLPKISGLPKSRTKSLEGSDTPSYIPTPKSVQLISKGNVPSYSPTPKQAEGSSKKRSSHTVEYDPVKNFAFREKANSDNDDANHSDSEDSVSSELKETNVCLPLQDKAVEAVFSDSDNNGGENKKISVDEDDLTDSDEDVSQSYDVKLNSEDKFPNYADLLTPSSYFTNKLNSLADIRLSTESATNSPIISLENIENNRSDNNNVSQHKSLKMHNSHQGKSPDHSHILSKIPSSKKEGNKFSGSSRSQDKFHRSSSTPSSHSQIKHSHADKSNKNSVKDSSVISSSKSLVKQSHTVKNGKTSLKDKLEKSSLNLDIKHSHKGKGHSNLMKDRPEKSSLNSQVHHSHNGNDEKDSLKNKSEKSSSSNSHTKQPHKDTLNKHLLGKSSSSHVKQSHMGAVDKNALKDKLKNSDVKHSYKHTGGEKNSLKDISGDSSSLASSNNFKQGSSSVLKKVNRHKSPSRSSKAESHSHKTGSSNTFHKSVKSSHDLVNGHSKHKKENTVGTYDKPHSHKQSDSKPILTGSASEIIVKSEHSSSTRSEKKSRHSSSDSGHQSDSHRHKSLIMPNVSDIKQERRESTDRIKSSKNDAVRRSSGDSSKANNRKAKSDSTCMVQKSRVDNCKSVTERRISDITSNLFGEESDGSDSDVQIVEAPPEPPALVYELSESDDNLDNKSEEDDFTFPFSDSMDMSDTDTFDECLRIFQETERHLAAKSAKLALGVSPDTAKLREAPKIAEASENLLMSVSKKRMAHKAAGQVIKTVKAPATFRPRLSPAEVMHNRIVEMQKRALLRAAKREGRESELPLKLSDNGVSSANNLHLVSNLSGSVIPPQSSSLSEAASTLISTQKKREARTPSVKTPTKTVPAAASSATWSPNSFYNKTKTGSSKPTEPTADKNLVTISSAASKTEKRKAHEPTLSNLKRPVIPTEFGSKVPSNVRQRYLNLIIDEYLKFNKEDTAFTKGQEEEQAVYNRASNKNIYLRVAVNAIKRIRTEALESQPSSSKKHCSGLASSASTASSSSVQSHEATLGGSMAAKTSFTLHRSGNAARITPQAFTGKELYDNLTKYILTEEQLRANGYPRPAEDGSSKAKFYKEVETDKMLKDYERTCRRCGKRFYVDKDGDIITVEQCVYHYANPYKKKVAGFIDSRYGCCNERVGSKGCQVAKFHVHEKNKTDCLTGYMRTLPASPSSTQNHSVFSLDCEMVYTKIGLELARVTVVGDDCSVKYETLVKPDAEIIDYNTRFSGITEKDMKGVTTNLRGVQAVMLSMISDQTILIGHSLESDLQSLKLIHSTVVDTSIVFPHRMGLPYKRALRSLMVDHLQKIIQADDGGHDSKEDAVACMQLMLFRVKADVRRRIL